MPYGISKVNYPSPVIAAVYGFKQPMAVYFIVKYGTTLTYTEKWEDWVVEISKVGFFFGYMGQCKKQFDEGVYSYDNYEIQGFNITISKERVNTK
jgi:hypothetical protein